MTASDTSISRDLWEADLSLIDDSGCHSRKEGCLKGGNVFSARAALGNVFSARATTWGHSL